MIGMFLFLVGVMFGIPIGMKIKLWEINYDRKRDGKQEIKQGNN